MGWFEQLDGVSFDVQSGIETYVPSLQWLPHIEGVYTETEGV